MRFLSRVKKMSLVLFFSLYLLLLSYYDDGELNRCITSTYFIWRDALNKRKRGKLFSFNMLDNHRK